MKEPNVSFIDSLIINYECPKCGHPQKQKFVFKNVNEEIEFTCKDCNFKNSLTMTESSGEE